MAPLLSLCHPYFQYRERSIRESTKLGRTTAECRQKPATLRMSMNRKGTAGESDAFISTDRTKPVPDQPTVLALLQDAIREQFRQWKRSQSRPLVLFGRTSGSVLGEISSSFPVLSPDLRSSAPHGPESIQSCGSSKPLRHGRRPSGRMVRRATWAPDGRSVVPDLTAG